LIVCDHKLVPNLGGVHIDDMRCGRVYAVADSIAFKSGIMDSPPPIPSTSRAAAVAAAAPSKKSAAPASQLDALSEFEVSQVTTEIATELFGVAPAIFTSRFVNLANDLIYHVVDKVDVEVHKRWAAEGSATTTGETLEERKQRVMKVRNIHAHTYKVY
jgi:hypothetical protein